MSKEQKQPSQKGRRKGFLDLLESLKSPAPGEAPKSPKRRKFIIAGGGLLTNVLFGCGPKIKLPFSGRPEENFGPLFPDTARVEAENPNDITDAEQKQVFLLLADSEAEIISPLEQIILKMSGYISAELTTIQQSAGPCDASLNCPAIDFLEKITEGSSAFPDAAGVNLSQATTAFPGQEQWQDVVSLLYIQGLLLSKAKKTQQAFNVFCSAKMLAEPLKESFQETETADVFLFAAANINHQLAGLVAGNPNLANPQNQEFLAGSLKAIRQNELANLMTFAKDVENMPADTGEQQESKRNAIEEIIRNFYSSMGLTSDESSAGKTDSPEQKLCQMIELTGPFAEDPSYDFWIDPSERTINGSYYQNGPIEKINPVSLRDLLNYFLENRNDSVSFGNGIYTLAEIKTKPEYQAAVAGLSDEEILSRAGSFGVVLLENCFYPEIVDGQNNSLGRQTVIALRVGAEKIMLAVSASQEINLLSGNDDRLVMQPNHQDFTVGGYTPTELLEFLAEFYSNPSLQKFPDISPAEMLMLSPKEEIERAVQANQYGIYVKPHAEITTLYKEGDQWRFGETLPSQSDKQNFGPLGTFFPLTEGKKVEATDPAGKATVYYLLGETGNAAAAVEASWTTAIEQRNFLQCLALGPHKKLFWFAVLQNFPVAILKRKIFPSATLGISDLTGGEIKIPVPAGLATALFDTSKALFKGNNRKPLKIFLSGLPVKALTETLDSGETTVEITTGFQLIKRPLLLKAFQILQALSLYILIKQLTAPQKSNLEAIMEATAPYWQKENPSRPQIWNDYNVNTKEINKPQEFSWRKFFQNVFNK